MYKPFIFKLGGKLMADNSKRDSLVVINGEVITVEERNRRMKLEYINGGKSLRDIAEEYGLT